MLLKVNPHKIEIDKSPVNEREINISKCEFEFADEITSDYVKEAYFTFGGTTYKQIIVNDECDFPSEVLVKKGTVEIGVVAYLVENETEIKRYNPSPAYFDTWVGSLKDNAENSEPITPTDKEQMEQAITNLQNDVDDLDETKQDKLVSGENIKTINGESVLGSGNIEVVTDLSDYYTKEEIDESQTAQNVKINANKDDIATLNNNLTNYSLITETGSQIALNINSSNYQMTAVLKDKNGNTIYTSNVIDLPIESMIINVAYDSTTKEIVFTLQSGTTLRVSVADLVSGLVSTDELNTILASYYTKTEIDTLLSAKANSSDVYTKNETDALLGGKVDTTTYTQGQATQDANIEENATNIDWLQTLVSQMPTVEATGTDISLQDVLNYRFMKFVMKGNSSQFSTTGKNLLPITNQDFMINSVRFQAINGKIKVSGTASTNITGFTMRDNNCFPVTLESGTYYLSRNLTNTTIGLLKQTGGDPVASLASTSTAKSVSFTLTETTQLYFFFYIPNGTTKNDTFEIMISTNDGDWEPYTGGIPAPNPNYPYPVKTVTGENSLVISNSDNTETQNYPLSLGNIELNSSPDGTVSDEIRGTLDNWYKREYIGKTTDTSGSTSITINDMLSNGSIYSYYGGTVSGKTITYSSAIPGENTIYYQKAEYTDVQITDTTLITQLNNIYNNAHSYNGTTNITSTYEDGNEQMVIDAGALKSWDDSNE